MDLRFLLSSLFVSLKAQGRCILKLTTTLFIFNLTYFFVPLIFFVKPQFTSRLWRLVPGFTRTHEPFCANFSFSIQVKQMTVQMKIIILNRKMFLEQTNSADKMRLGKNKVCQRLDDEKYKFAL